MAACGPTRTNRGQMEDGCFIGLGFTATPHTPMVGRPKLCPQVQNILQAEKYSQHSNNSTYMEEGALARGQAKIAPSVLPPHHHCVSHPRSWSKNVQKKTLKLRCKALLRVWYSWGAISMVCAIAPWRLQFGNHTPLFDGNLLGDCRWAIAKPQSLGGDCLHGIAVCISLSVPILLPR